MTSRTPEPAGSSLTRAEDAVLTIIHYGFITPARLPSVAARESFGANLVTEEECQAALAACLDRGWAQVIDERALRRIKDDLHAGGYLGPVYRLPRLGDVDFTSVGVELWQKICGPDGFAPVCFAFSDLVCRKSSCYFKTRAAALAFIQETKEWDEDITVFACGPFRVGPWRSHWWRRFSQGFRIDIEERYQWQGRGCDRSEGCLPREFPVLGHYPQRLRDILARHNVTFAEWILMATLDLWGAPRPCSHLSWVVESAERQFGLIVSEEECRAGLEACLRYGWLRVADKDAIAEIDRLLRDDPALMPVAVHRESLGQLDFTPSGAALYRTIAAGWLGPSWEDGLQVEKENYREAHWYSQAEEGVQGVLQEYAAGGEKVTASRLVPIGPWCVKWWERYPSGCRLEMEIGEA